LAEGLAFIPIPRVLHRFYISGGYSRGN